MEELEQEDEPQENFETYKFFSKQVYSEIIIPEYRTQRAEVWQQITTLSGEGFRPYKKDNFVASAYKRNSEIIIAFRGTDDIKDIFADTKFLVKASPKKSVKYAKEYYNAVKQDYLDCKISLTGHSLGGAYAQILSYMLVKEKDNNLMSAITFNAPGTDYLLEEGEEDEIKAILKTMVSNYVIMNDYVGNFQAHIGDTYYFQPYLLNKQGVNEKGEKERITAHGCILDYNLKDFGPRYQHPEEFGTKNAWALWVFDVNNTNPSENPIRIALDNLMRVKTQDLERAMGIINSSDIKLFNSFHYKTNVDTYDLFSYEENCRIDALIKAQNPPVEARV